METNKIKKVVPVILFMLFLGFLQLMYLHRSKSIDENKRHAVGKITEYSDPISSGPQIYYVFKVQEDRIRTFQSFDRNYSDYKNKFFVVEYSSENPEWSRMILDDEITDTLLIKEAGFSLPKKSRNQFQAQ